ncbi:hypothetical protein [Mesorhizobium shangrilense]|uniref:Uncharacterized protein n=1 Tax=Mesorhizobium shangrilense TaxID=460060 RepID=A0ABV2DJS0_9HYPH
MALFSGRFQAVASTGLLLAGSKRRVPGGNACSHIGELFDPRRPSELPQRLEVCSAHATETRIAGNVGLRVALSLARPRQWTRFLAFTALAGFVSLAPVPLHAQVTVITGTAGDSGDNIVVLGTDGDSGHAPSPDPLVVNNNSVISSGGPVFGGISTGGAGGKGGNAIGFGVCPLCTPVALGGDGNNGAAGGGVIAGNTGNLAGSADGGHGLVAASIGGRGGDGGSVTGIGNALVSKGGDAGNGASGGSAEANAGAGSVINTTGVGAFGILARSEGGVGGTGGGVGGASPLAIENAGKGGGGGSGGSASATNDGEVRTTSAFSVGMLVRSAGATGGDGGSAGGLVPGIIASGGNGGAATLGGSATGTNNGDIRTGGDYADLAVRRALASGVRQRDGLGRCFQFRWQCQHILFRDARPRDRH